MALKLKMFPGTGAVTMVTSPSMMQGGDLGFTMVALKEKEKNYFATEVNKVFPDNDVVMYVHGGGGEKGWLNQAIRQSNYVVMDESSVPVWIQEMVPENKRYFINEDQTVVKIFETINQERANG